jgi:hypothetical protein
VSGALYQPFTFGCRDGVALAWGAVASYLSVNVSGSELPALSRQLPVIVVDATSGPAKLFVASHESTAEVASVAAKPTVSGAVYQPVAFGWRDGVAAVCGAVASYLTAEDARAAFPALSRHVPLTDAEPLSGPE